MAAMILVLLKTFYSGLKEPHCPLDVSKGHAALAANTTLRGASNVTVRAAAGWTRCAISCPAMMTRIMSVRPRAVSAPVISAPNDGGKPRNTSPLAKARSRAYQAFPEPAAKLDWADESFFNCTHIATRWIGNLVPTVRAKICGSLTLAITTTERPNS